MATRRARQDGDELLTVEELADYLHKPKQTIYGWNSRGNGAGPPYHKVGRTVLYRRRDVDAWLDQRRVDGAA